ITLIKTLGEDLEENYPGTNVRVYSQFPFPHRTAEETQIDEFEEAALAALEQDPATPFYQLETVNGRLSMRYAEARVMKQGCVACHNSHPDSPKTDWQVGDVRGVREIIVPVDEADAGLQGMVGLIIGGLAALAGIIIVSFRYLVTTPVEVLAETSRKIKAGDLQARAKLFSNDEIGVVGGQINSMLDDVTELIQSREESRDSLQESIIKLLDEVSDVADGDLTVEAEVTEDATGAIADSFNFMISQLREIINSVQETTLQVGSSANEIQVTAEHLAQGSELQSTQIVDTSAALDEMSISIQQVSENATLSADMGEQALSNARRGSKAVENVIIGTKQIQERVQETARRIQRLGESSQEVGKIVQLIEDIADRTSILALNASIQASMAGEAGAGFAVVAGEVEDLADQATEATKQIGTLIRTIQSETHEAVIAMESTMQDVIEGEKLTNEAGVSLEEIESVSLQLSELNLSISLAAQQQARGSETIARAMNDIAEVTQQTAAGTKEAAVSINNLANLADDLRGSVSTFKLPSTNGNRR
ncbi:MAG: DUF3365 domain-containing protein, partial [Methylococcales bacterium]|nr:DUF3365 domain-containing protein [Methylococcales bacterium]